MFGSLIPRRERPLFPAPDRFSRMIGRMEEELEDLFGRFGGEDGGARHVTYFTPKVDVVETENEFEVTVDLPGMKREDVHVEVKDGDLWISGTRAEEKEEKGKTYHRVERRYGEFRRVFPLPTTVDGDKMVAKYDNGVLRITAPKMEEAKPKRIEVKA
jgi:HSP20 family protein